MLIILTSAKTMTGTSKIKAPAGTMPRFAQEANEIALNMAQFSTDDLKKILKLNPKLALENYNRFQEFHTAEVHSLQALLAYTGVVFKNINPKDFTEDDFLYANDHLRIASICYGLLRPLDLIKPYRMEYEVKLPELGEGNMYNYWRPRQTELLIDEVKKSDNILINLASQEIQGAYDWKKVGSTVRIITPEFKVWKDGKAQTIVIYMKMTRGQMTRYILKNRITDPEALKNFSWEGFTYDESLSNGDNWVFLQS
ncbi:peroxide stress protein YaaA [Parabacteroides segnis]|uniref:peroxide stress protein YaaA n=1 Tax=Parabacteroides segnis TaxID=2763058 RepID=UPI003516FB59